MGKPGKAKLRWAIHWGCGPVLCMLDTRTMVICWAGVYVVWCRNLANRFFKVYISLGGN